MVHDDVIPRAATCSGSGGAVVVPQAQMPAAILLSRSSQWRTAGSPESSRQEEKVASSAPSWRLTAKDPGYTSAPKTRQAF
eukprot:CAMPEP_0170639274 /NCGR_PEP_ID=MMETSP0224-20130122/39554_1 /TAXON_ID=285029 /ORGANISM="Togula jolla, Strain CCCM 725" /LENGTH=80 /DNA_ID=CAMNT_0010969603 /DNA_START=144 /DNA_END=386 /DNA_ORIENTATION=+